MPAIGHEHGALARNADPQPIDETIFVPALGAYTEGKMKRYNLLFSVNGGAFAVLALLVGDSSPSAEQMVFGGLNLRLLAVGMALFTVVMCGDIFNFGEMMRKRYGGETFFQFRGKAVLAAIGTLIAAGWLLAAFG